MLETQIPHCIKSYVKLRTPINVIASSVIETNFRESIKSMTYHPLSTEMNKYPMI